MDKKTEAINAYLIKNGKGEEEKSLSQVVERDWTEFYGCVK